MRDESCCSFNSYNWLIIPLGWGFVTFDSIPIHCTLHTEHCTTALHKHIFRIMIIINVTLSCIISQYMYDNVHVVQVVPVCHVQRHKLMKDNNDNYSVICGINHDKYWSERYMMFIRDEWSYSYTFPVASNNGLLNVLLWCRKTNSGLERMAGRWHGGDTWRPAKWRQEFSFLIWLYEDKQ